LAEPRKHFARIKTVLPNADFVIEGSVDPTEPLRLSACGT
jgi:hypothetical protein